MGLTFAEFKKVVAPYAGRAGKCASSDEVSMFARLVMASLLHEGSTSAIRKVCIIANKGCVSLPPEVETPLKIKIDRKVSHIWSKWCSMSNSTDDMRNCMSVDNVLEEDGSETPLAYDLPDGGSKVAVIGNCEEAEGAFIIVQGKDPTGRQIITHHKGEQIPGVKLTIQKGKATSGDVVFGEITGVVKPKTNGYVSLVAITDDNEVGRFLADWSPTEERPSYRRFRIIDKSCPSLAHVSILCRVKLRDSYLDNEITLFDNPVAIMLAAQRVQAEVNNDVDIAAYKRTALQDNLEKEAGYKRAGEGVLNIFKPLSGGSIKNLM